MSTFTTRLLLAQIAMSRSNTDKIKAKVKSNQCIIDGCSRKLRSRGLCEKCYQSYRQQMRELSPTEQIEFERSAIEQGLVLDNGEMGKWKKQATNRFANLAAKVVG
ncbi:hypothetical protein [Roseiconus lacunae]|uniref:DUF1289 domain-containing protein n=1 Tax=Roseiconus lacunae TaxID=2605694 RepID=A0ABT7PH19_9BACT|nr:hypothetical protein [Roseiconus lacunae]MDM4015808.1 hypothetical protein [Roseiconus lacunae]